MCAKTLTTATAVNSPSHSSSGLSFTAASAQYVNTGLTYNTTNFPSHSMCISMYISNTIAANQIRYGMRLTGADATRCWACVSIISLGATTNSLYGANGTGSPTASIATSAAGMYVQNIASSTSHRIIYNDTTTASNTTTTLAPLDTTSIFPYGCANTPTSGFSSYTTGIYKSFTIGTSLTTGQQTSLYNAMLAYQTALGRN